MILATSLRDTGRFPWASRLIVDPDEDRLGLISVPGFHQGVAGMLCLMQVEFLHEKPVNGGIERERVSRRLRDAANTIHVEALRALEEKINLGATDLKRRGRARDVEAVSFAGVVVVGHRNSEVRRCPYVSTNTITSLSLLRKLSLVVYSSRPKSRILPLKLTGKEV